MIVSQEDEKLLEVLQHALDDLEVASLTRKFSQFTQNELPHSRTYLHTELLYFFFYVRDGPGVSEVDILRLDSFSVYIQQNLVELVKKIDIILVNISSDELLDESWREENSLKETMKIFLQFNSVIVELDSVSLILILQLLNIIRDRP